MIFSLPYLKCICLAKSKNRVQILYWYALGLTITNPKSRPPRFLPYHKSLNPASPKWLELANTQKLERGWQWKRWKVIFHPDPTPFQRNTCITVVYSNHAVYCEPCLKLFFVSQSLQKRFFVGRTSLVILQKYRPFYSKHISFHQLFCLLVSFMESFKESWSVWARRGVGAYRSLSQIPSLPIR